MSYTYRITVFPRGNPYAIMAATHRVYVYSESHHLKGV